MTTPTPIDTSSLAAMNQAIAVLTQAYIRAVTAPRATRDPATIAAAKAAVDAAIALRDQLYP